MTSICADVSSQYYGKATPSAEINIPDYASRVSQVQIYGIPFVKTMQVVIRTPQCRCETVRDYARSRA